MELLKSFSNVFHSSVYATELSVRFSQIQICLRSEHCIAL